MQIALNGKIPTLEQLKDLSTIIPTAFSLGGWNEYEENIEWDNMTIVYPNGDILRSADYPGLWELLTLDNRWDKCSDELKLDILGDLYSHFMWYFTPSNHGGEVSEDIELFEETEAN